MASHIRPDEKAGRFRWANRNLMTIIKVMIRLREIIDPELRQRITTALAQRRGVSVAAIPDWFELDDMDYVDLLNDLKEQDYESERDYPR